ncbi:MAG: hypothetical protein MN733_27575 [Nitrososphaera sp.]|nr:hypothetical protein [Nitrososphaera sp.]
MLKGIMKNESIPSPYFLRRIGPEPGAGAERCVLLDNCPDLWELQDGDFAVIGADVTEQLRPHLPPGAGCGEGEKIVRLPRRTLVLAKSNIPEAL